MEVLFRIIGVLVLICFVWFIWRCITVAMLFKKGHNPYTRICKKCDNRQDFFQSNIEGNEDSYWWEDVGDGGNDENCPCHKYSHYHPFGT